MVFSMDKKTHLSIEGHEGVFEPVGNVTISVEFDGDPLIS